MRPFAVFGSAGLTSAGDPGFSAVESSVIVNSLHASFIPLQRLLKNGHGAIFGRSPAIAAVHIKPSRCTKVRSSANHATSVISTDTYHSLLPTATSFLPILANPLNLSLLASQLLVAPAIWDHPVDLLTCRKLMSVFNTAAIAVLKNDDADEARMPYGKPKIEREAWVKAVVSGADDKSPRWRHLLLIGGTLIGFEGQNRQGLSWSMRGKLESALVTAARLALEESGMGNGVDAHCIAMVLNYTFELISDPEKANLDYDRLLPVMIQTTYSSPEGLQEGYFLGAIDKDIVEVPGKRFKWPAQSVTFAHVSAILSSPLVSSLGPLSRLTAHTIENTRDPALVSQAVDHIANFCRTLMVQWRQNKLSEVDRTEEAEFLDPDSLSSTIPALWKLLRNCLYSTVIILRAVLGRVINDPILASNRREFFRWMKWLIHVLIFLVAPFLSMQALHTLRNLYFVSSRIGQNSSSQHTFVTLAAVDILSQYPDLAENFLRSIKPSELGQIPAHPLERCLDLFFLNTAELFTFILPPEPSEELLVSASLPYLAAGANKLLLEIFEAAHSVVLAVFAIPENAAVAAKHLPFYIDNLFAVCYISYRPIVPLLTIAPGIPEKPFSTPIPPRFQDSCQSSCPAFAHVKPTTSTAVHITTSPLRSCAPRLNHAPTTILTGNTDHRIRQDATSLRASRTYARHDRLALFPLRQGPRRMAALDGALDQCTWWI